MARQLAEFRAEAVAQAGGSSSAAVKDLVLRMLQLRPTPRSVLDVGAGRGELLRTLHSSFPGADLAGSDFLERPSALPSSITWHCRDFNDESIADKQFDVVTCSEVIEHVENPRHLLRAISTCVLPGGTLILTTPNQESVRSYVTLVARGHFAAFQDDSYPAHLVALLRVDLRRILAESGFSAPVFYYSDSGRLPGLTRYSWQGVPRSPLRGRLFSDNIGLTATRL